MKNSTKKTIDLSRLDDTMEILKKHRIPYKLFKLDNIQGLGLNDMVPVIESKRRHLIRKLEYENKVMVERFVRFQHKDLDDFIISYTFDRKDFPENWTTCIIK